MGQPFYLIFLLLFSFFLNSGKPLGCARRWLGILLTFVLLQPSDLGLRWWLQQGFDMLDLSFLILRLNQLVNLLHSLPNGLVQGILQE